MTVGTTAGAAHEGSNPTFCGWPYLSVPQSDVTAPADAKKASGRLHSRSIRFLSIHDRKRKGANTMANQTHIPFIPKMSTQFRRIQYLYCESETSSKVVTRADFMRLLAQQPCPMAQVNIDLEGGYAYLFPYCPERAEAFIQLNREMAAEYKRHYRNWQKLKAGTRKPELSLGHGDDRRQHDIRRSAVNGGYAGSSAACEGGLHGASCRFCRSCRF